MAIITEPTPRLTMGLDDLIRHLEQSDDLLVKQLAVNLVKMKRRQDDLKKESQGYGGGHNPSSYAAVVVGGVIELITDEMVFSAVDESKLSPKQKELFSQLQKSFPGMEPRELESDGSVIFHGRGKVCRMSPDGKIDFIGDAPSCPHCATNIMRKIDAGYTVAQCDHCGNAVRDVSTED